MVAQRKIAAFTDATSSWEDIRLYTRPIASGVEATVQASHLRFSREQMQDILHHFCDVFVEVQRQLLGVDRPASPLFLSP